jgi:response regulator RpfG family c-di-GMP phosphodiesterase
MMDRSGRRDTEHHNVLLVDDNRGEATSHRRRLESRGYHVIKTSDVDVALTMARQVPAIFLIAAGLGSERTPFLLALKRDDHTRHIPVTILPFGPDESLERLGLSRVGRDLW